MHGGGLEAILLHRAVCVPGEVELGQLLECAGLCLRRFLFGDAPAAHDERNEVRPGGEPEKGGLQQVERLLDAAADGLGLLEVGADGVGVASAAVAEKDAVGAPAFFEECHASALPAWYGRNPG